MKEKDLEKVVSVMKIAKKVFVITGAGISAESGIPVFRGSEGLWKNHDPMQLATPEAFEKDPVLVWQWYLWRRSLVARANPNAAHKVLSRWEKTYPGFLIATQNVDRLHHRAGNEKVVEIHGNIWEVRCTKTGRVFSPEEVDITEENLPPKSPEGGLFRPNVVWFGEILPPEPLDEISAFLSQEPPDICFVIGTSALFYYIQSWAHVVKMHGGLLVEINPDETPLSARADICLRAPAATALTRINELCS